MKKIILVAIVLAGIGLLGMLPGVVNAEVQPETIKTLFVDPNLRKEISLILDKGDNDQITNDDIKKVTSLILKNKGIEELTGLEVFTELTYLDASGNNISTLPKDIGTLKKLRVLNLNDNELQGLSAVIGEFEGLEVLSISSNNLRSLPVEIGNLTKLEQLQLKDNLIEGLPEEIGMLDTLEILILENNLITKLPDGIGKLVNLTILDLGSNKLNELPKALGNLGKLYFIDLSLNSIYKIDSTAYNHLISLKGCYLFNQNYQENLVNKGLVNKNYSIKALDIFKMNLGYNIKHILIGPDGSETEITYEAGGQQFIIDGENLKREGTYLLKTIISGGPVNSFGSVIYGSEGSVYRQSFVVASVGSLPYIENNATVFIAGAIFVAGLTVIVLGRLIRIRSEK